VGQLGFYARRLKQEEITRRVGLVFVILAVIVQCLAVFQPPSAANASSSNDFVSGGLGLASNGSYDFNNYLRAYDGNQNHLKDIMTYMGITRDQIVAAGTRVSGNTRSGANLVHVNNGNLLSWGHNPQFSAAQGEQAVNITDANGASITTVYARPLRLQPGSSGGYWMLQGSSSRVGTFYIMQACGNLVTSFVPGPPAKPTPPPAPTPAKIALSKTASNATQGNVAASSVMAKAGDTVKFTLTAKNSGQTAGTLTMSDHIASLMQYSKLSDNGGGTLNSSDQTISWANVSVPGGGTVTKTFAVKLNNPLPVTTAACSMSNTFGTSNIGIGVNCQKPPANIVQSKSVTNITQGDVNATTVTAQAGDQLHYILTAKNTGGTAAQVQFSDHLADTLEYATLIDNGGGTFDKDSKTLTWNTATLQPGASESRSFVVQMLSPIPATPEGTSDPTSYDCQMVNTYGNSVSVMVNCPAPKVVEQTTSQLPHTGPTANLVFAGAVLAIVVYFYARSRQLSTEVRLIRRDVSAGTL